MTRDDALALMHEYTESDALRKHMYAVEIAMRACARRDSEDEEAWATVGLLHDFDYERFPNEALSATEEHPAHGVGILRVRRPGHDDRQERSERSRRPSATRIACGHRHHWTPPRTASSGSLPM